MKKNKVIIAILVISMYFSVTVFAATGILFTNGGNNFIYSDNPENIKLHSKDTNVFSSLIYLYGTELENKYKDVEFYHFIAKNYYEPACRIGVAIKNPNNKSVKVTYKGECYVEDCSGDLPRLTNVSYVLKNFKNKTKITSIVVGAKQSVVVWGANFKTSRVNSKFVFGRATIKATMTVQLRVFAADKNKTATDIFRVSKPISGNGLGQFCGELNYTQKDAILDANSNNTFTICEWPNLTETDSRGLTDKEIFEKKIGLLNNINEYGGVIESKENCKSINAGNYGVTYNIRINNASGKRIKITPQWSARVGITNPIASIVYCINDGEWKIAPIISPNMCWIRELGTAPTATFKFILAGGNSGNYDISFQ